MSDVFIEIIAVLQLWTNRDTWSFSNVDCYTADQGLAADRVKSIKDASLLISDKIKSVESVILTVANKRDDFNHWQWTKTAEFKSESCRNLFRNSDHNFSKNPETIHLKIRPCSSKISNCGSSETPAAVHPKLWPAFKWNSGSSSEHLAVICLKLGPPNYGDSSLKTPAAVNPKLLLTVHPNLRPTIYPKLWPRLSLTSAVHPKLWLPFVRNIHWWFIQNSDCRSTKIPVAVPLKL